MVDSTHQILAFGMASSFRSCSAYRQVTSYKFSSCFHRLQLM